MGTSGEIIRKALRGDISSSDAAEQIEEMEQAVRAKQKEKLRPRWAPRWLWAIAFALLVAPFQHDAA